MFLWNWGEKTGLVRVNSINSTHTLVRQNVCSRGSYWFMIFCSWKGRCTQTCLKNDKLSTVAAVNESQNSEIEMVSWQVRLTDQVRYHQHSSSVFVGARLNGLLAPPALKLKNWNAEKLKNSQIPWKQGLTPHTHTRAHTHTNTYTNTHYIFTIWIDLVHFPGDDLAEKLALLQSPFTWIWILFFLVRKLPFRRPGFVNLSFRRCWIATTVFSRKWNPALLVVVSLQRASANASVIHT